MPKKKYTLKQQIMLHGRAGLVRVAPGHHTGKKLPRHHTSHGVLLLMVLVTGAALLLSSGSLQTAAYQHAANNLPESTTVTATISGPSPTAGAIITNPQDLSRVTKPLLNVAGTCPATNVVVLSRNGQFAGSTVCQSDGRFTIIIQLDPGSNLLQAQNYDQLQQAGPATSPITVFYDQSVILPPITTIDQEESVSRDEDISVDPSLPPAPTVPPVDCANQTSQVPSDAFRIIVSCAPTTGFVNETLSFGFRLNGGSPAYAFSVDWGDGSADDLFSFASAGDHTVSHTFKTPGYHQVKLRVVDINGQSYQNQVVVMINGVPAAASLASPDAWYTFWLNATIPLYLLIAALVVGFWFGDIFERMTGTPAKRRAKA